MPRITLVVQGPFRNGFYSESRRVHRNWLLVGLIVGAYLAKLRIVARPWGWAAISIYKTFTKQHVKGRHAGGVEVRQAFLADLTQPLPAIDIPVLEGKVLKGHRSPEDSGGWKIITGQFAKGRHADSVDLVDA